MTAYKIIDHVYDVVVVGAGGAGLRATMGAAEKGLKTVVDDYVHDENSHALLHGILTFAGIGGASLALFSLAKIAFGAA